MVHGVRLSKLKHSHLNATKQPLYQHVNYVDLSNSVLSDHLVQLIGFSFSQCLETTTNMIIHRNCVIVCYQQVEVFLQV